MIELRRAARAREEFDEFVAESTDELLRTGYLIAWDLADAEDLVQETLLRVAKQWPRVRSMDHPRAYARRVLTNLALDGAERRSRRRIELDGRPREEPAVDDAPMVDARSELLAALATLSVRQRTVLVLRYFVDLPESEVAAILRCSLGTVKSTTSRALAKLEQHLSNPEINETRSAR